MTDIGRGIAATFAEPLIPIDEVDGIGPSYADKLEAAGVVSIRALVERCQSPEAITRLSKRTTIPGSLIAKWVRSTDLTRINGVGDEYMSLLHAIGVTSIGSLAEQDPETLHHRAAECNEEGQLVGTTPSADTLGDWIDQARNVAQG